MSFTGYNKQGRSKIVPGFLSISGWREIAGMGANNGRYTDYDRRNPGDLVPRLLSYCTAGSRVPINR